MLIWLFLIAPKEKRRSDVCSHHTSNLICSSRPLPNEPIQLPHVSAPFIGSECAGSKAIWWNNALRRVDSANFAAKLLKPFAQRVAAEARKDRAETCVGCVGPQDSACGDMLEVHKAMPTANAAE